MKAAVAAAAVVAVLVVAAVRVASGGPGPAAAAPGSSDAPAAASSGAAPPAKRHARRHRRRARHGTRPRHATSERPAPSPRPRRPAGRRAVVARVVDGDTIDLTNGQTVRFLQIDTPELHGSECYSGQARDLLERLLPAGAAVTLAADPSLDRVDRYGRILRYVYRGATNLNVAMVARGAAAPYFFDGDRGRFAGRLLADALAARRAHRGLWGACPAARLEPDGAVSTSPAPAPAPAPAAGGGNCTPGYSPCLPVRDDWDCGELTRTYRVTGSDPYRLDGDGDGYGCE